MKTFLASWQATILSVMRIVTGLLLMQHGGQKAFGFPAPQHGPFELVSLLGLAGVLELAGGALIIVGLFTRPTAFVLSGMMAVAYFLMHAPKALWPLVNGGELAAIYCFVFLYLSAAGGGTWSLDALRGKS